MAPLTGPPQRCLGEVVCAVGAGRRRCDGAAKHIGDVSVTGRDGAPLGDLDGVIGVLAVLVHTY